MNNVVMNKVFVITDELMKMTSLFYRTLVESNPFQLFNDVFHKPSQIRLYFKRTQNPLILWKVRQSKVLTFTYSFLSKKKKSKIKRSSISFKYLKHVTIKEFCRAGKYPATLDKSYVFFKIYPGLLNEVYFMLCKPLKLCVEI